MRKHITLIIGILLASSHTMSAIEIADSTTRMLGEVEVTATRATKEVASTAPLRIFEHSEIERIGVVDVSDVLHRMPGVTLRDYGGAGGLKTASVRSFGAAHTGVSYDGVPLSDVQSGQIDLSRYSINNVNSVSLVIGDNDDIFIPARASSYAATVGITSLPTIDKSEIDAKLQLGSFGLINPFLKTGTSIGKKSAMNFVGEFTHADNDYPFTLYNGEATSREKRSNSRMNSGHAEVNFITQLDSCNTLTAKAYYYLNSRQLPGPVVVYNNVNHEHLRESNAFGQASLRSRLSSTVSLKSIFKFNWASSHYQDLDNRYPGGKLDQSYIQREYYGSLSLLWIPQQHWSFNFATDYFYNNLNSNLPVDPHARRHSALASATAKYSTKQLTIMGRLLGSLYAEQCKTEAPSDPITTRLSPSLSLSWQPIIKQQIFLRGSYKNIFRMPTFSERYFEHYGTQNVKPENTDQLNLGVTYTVPSIGALSQATFTLDGYLNHIDDMIVAVPYNMFVWSMTNLGKVRAVGVDLTASLTIKPSEKHSINFTGAYSYQRSMPRTNSQASDWMKQVAYIPRHSGSASLSWENPWANLSINTTALSDRYTTNANLPETRIAGYGELGASLWRNFVINKITTGLRLDVQNILNKQYCIVARYPMPGRQIKFTISIKI